MLVRDKQLVNGISIPYGSITLTDTFSDTGSLNAREYEKAAKFMREQYQKLDWLQDGLHLPVIGLGGSIRTLVKVEKRKKKRPYEALHNFKVSYDAVKTVSYTHLVFAGFQTRIVDPRNLRMIF